MTTKQSQWSYQGGTDPNIFRKALTKLSRHVRSQQYEFFIRTYKPTAEDTILDVGTSPDMTLTDTNFFEQVYSFNNKLFIASIEDCSNIVKQYKLAGFIQMSPNENLSIEDKAFDYVISWATLEHVGSRENQEKFVKELCRIGKHVFITTPDRYSIYEPHTVLFFLHWLPLTLFRKLLLLFNKPFWAKEENLNPVSFKDAHKFIEGTPLQITRYKVFGFLPAHFLIHGK